MTINLPLSEMTTAEKMALIETIWEDIERNSEGLEIPQWQIDELEARERRLEAGMTKVVDWEEAKARLRRRFE